MIRLYAENETNFDNNGLAVLDADIKENTVEEKMNGIYEFDFAYLSSGKYANLLDGDMIVKAPTPDGNQLFRIIKVTKNIGYLEVNCYHIFYDLAGNFIEDINIVGQNGQDALDHMDTGMQYPTRFKFMSNMTQARNARMVRLNAVQALLDASQDNSFLSRWGGEIKRDNFTVLFNDVRGNDKGFKVQHGKNLTGYEAEIDYSTVVTKIMPYGYDGLMLPEKYVDSPLKDKYAFTRIKKIEYKDIKAIDPEATTTDEDAVPLEQAYAQLRAAASREYSVNKIDIPTSNFKITFKNLADTKEYVDFKALEKALPWDYVTVVTPDFNIKSRMISYQYDALTKQYKKIELGNYVPAFTDTTTSLNNQLNNVNDGLNNLTDDVNTVAKSADGKNSNYYGPDEPFNPASGDLWYKKNGDKTELWQYDGTTIPPGWKLLVDDATGEEVKNRVDEVQEETQKVVNDANNAVNDANNAVLQAGFANDTANKAKTDAANAQSDASAAVTQASSAAADSKEAKQIVGAVSQSYTTLTDGSTMTIAELESGLAAKLTRTDLDGYATQTWAQNKIKMTADGINGTISSVKDTVDDHTTSIHTLQSDSNGFKDQFTKVNNTLGKHTTDIGTLQASSKELTSNFNSLSSDNTTNKNDISQLKQTATEFNSTLMTVQTQVNNSAVGTNLLKGTGDHIVTGTDNNDYLSNETTDDLLTLFKGLEGQTVTVSVDYEYSGFVAGSSKNRMGWEARIVADTLTYFGPWYYPNNDSGSGRISTTFVVPKNITRVEYAKGWIQFSGSGTGKLSHLKLEKGSVATDWSPAPEDMATTVQFTSIEETLKGVQITANNAVTQSQYTQLADQFTTTINGVKADLNGLAIGGRNYISNSDQTITINGDTDHYKVFYRKLTPGIWTFSANAKYTRGNDTAIAVKVYNAGHKTWISTTKPKIVNGRIETTFNVTSDAAKELLIYASHGNYFGTLGKTIEIDHYKLERGNKSTDWSPAPEDVSSQITQLKDDINLRVTKNGVINQINISPESILIAGEKVHITGQTSIDNAVIKDAMIANIKADKITAGTLNASKVNLINLNASNITTGVIHGANLSINLNNGEILFQKGTIKSTNGNLNIDIDSGNMAVVNSAGNGFRFENGKLFLATNTWIDSFQSKPEFGSIAFKPGFLSNVKGMQITGTDGIAVTAGDYDTFSFIFQHQPKSGAALALHDNTALLNARELTRIEGGGMYTETWPWTNQARASIVVGGANGGTDRGVPTDQNGTYHLQEPVSVGSDLFMKGHKITLQAGRDNSTTNSLQMYQKADLNLGNDGKGFISSAAIYNRTYSDGSHVVLTKYGTIGRLTSARKYKIADQVADQVIKKAKRILAIKPAEWYDKAEIEAIANAETKGTNAPPEAMIEKHYGFIADDFDEAGLNEIVLYKNGEVDSLEYERISMYHNVILSDHEKRISTLENELKRIRFLERSKR